MSWQAFFKDLKSRGLTNVDMVISDAHKSILNAVVHTYSNAAWQRCQVHFVRNILNYTPAKYQAGLKVELRNMFNALTINEARSLRDEIINDYAPVAEKAMQTLDDGFEDAMTVMQLPPHMRIKLRSSNMIERLNREFKRRSQVVQIFPNETPFIVAGLVDFLLLGILTGTILAGLMPENYSEYSSAFGLGTGHMGIIEILWLVVAAPVAEEIMCRGVVFKAVRSGHGFWLAAIISSLLWAVIHMDLIQGISTFILGLLLALLMEKFGSLWVCIGAHMLNNVIAILPSDVFTLPNELKYRVIMAVAVTVVVLALTRALAVHKTDVPDADTGISII